MDADKNMYHLKETKKEKKLVVIGKGGERICWSCF